MMKIRTLLVLLIISTPGMVAVGAQSIDLAEAQSIIRTYTAKTSPELSPDYQLEIAEYKIDDLWATLQIQLYKVKYLSEDGASFRDGEFLYHEGSLMPFCKSFGGAGLMSGLVQDSALYYTYSFGSGIHRAHAGRVFIHQGQLTIAESGGYMLDLFATPCEESGVCLTSGTYTSFNTWSNPKDSGWHFGGYQNSEAIIKDGNNHLVVPDFPYKHPLSGLWKIHQPMHALYEATLYYFHPKGSLEIVGWFPENYETGTVEDSTGTIECSFRHTWQRPNPTTLVFGSTCSDNVERNIDMTFYSSGRNIMPDKISVGNDTGWQHWGFAWEWERCVEETECIEDLERWGGSPINRRSQQRSHPQVQIRIYQDNLHIIPEKSEPIRHLSIYNTSGVQIMTFDNIRTDINLNTQAFKKGIHYFKIQEDGVWFLRPFVL